jgi:hypothetical protein
MMSETTRQARRVLTAWKMRDREQIEQELDRAEAFCARPASAVLDEERREVLSSVVRHLRSGKRAGAAVRLLEHLSMEAVCA